jgi:hypothetical protein
MDRLFRDLVAEAIRRLLAEPSGAKRQRMTEAPIKLPPGHTTAIRSNSELAQLFDQEDITHLNDVQADANVLFPLLVQGRAAHDTVKRWWDEQSDELRPTSALRNTIICCT